MPRRQLSEGNTRASEIRRVRGEALLTEQALFFGVFQVCEGKCLASEERQTRAMGKGACLVSRVWRSSLASRLRLFTWETRKYNACSASYERQDAEEEEK